MAEEVNTTGSSGGRAAGIRARLSGMQCCAGMGTRRTVLAALFTQFLLSVLAIVVTVFGMDMLNSLDDNTDLRADDGTTVKAGSVKAVSRGFAIAVIVVNVLGALLMGWGAVTAARRMSRSFLFFARTQTVIVTANVILLFITGFHFFSFVPVAFMVFTTSIYFSHAKALANEATDNPETTGQPPLSTTHSSGNQDGPQVPSKAQANIGTLA